MIILFRICLFVFFVVSAVCADNQKVNSMKSDAMQRLSWLIGTWKSIDGETTNYEIWKKESDARFSGLAMTVKGADTTISEKMSIQSSDSGTFFVADVAHNPAPVYFKMISQDSVRTVFENPEHDFPTRVIYGNPKKDSLHARIEGKNKGKDVGMDFIFEREK